MTENNRWTKIFFKGQNGTTHPSYPAGQTVMNNIGLRCFKKAFKMRTVDDVQVSVTVQIPS